MRTARPPALQNPSRSAHGRLRIHRGVVQPPSPSFRPRLSFTDQLRKDAANRKSNRKPNTVHRNGVAPELVEHPFGTLKRPWNQGYFLLRSLAKVRAEMSLSILAYNLRRVLNILGTQPLMAALATATP